MYLCTKIVELQQDMNENFSLTLKEWADEDKPREKMLNKGKKELTNAELIAILLRSGLRGKSVVEVAKEVLSFSGNKLTNLSQLEFSQLSAIKGVGPAKATTLMAALELGWRMHGEIGNDKEVILNDSTTFFSYMTPLIADLDHEEFWAVYLSNRGKVLGRQPPAPPSTSASSSAAPSSAKPWLSWWHTTIPPARSSPAARTKS